MEQSISSLAFKGSIVEAITEAKRQKKLFVVYTSGDNEDSGSMDKSTWSDSSVAESVSKYCILLHILEGSTDAAQFSALYPQKAAPCITAIGYNGIQLWQNEGFVSAANLASNLEKAWLSLHVQETTATFLTAALASRQSEQIPTKAPTTSHEVGSSSAASTNNNASGSVDKKDIDQHKEKSENHAPVVEEINSKVCGDVSHGPSVDKMQESNIEQPKTTTRELVNNPVTQTEIDTGVDKKQSLNVNQHGEDSVEAPRVVSDEVKPEKSGSLQTEKDDYSDLATNKSTDIHLNIRLPGGASLQEKFEPTSTLRMVKDYVDEKQESNFGSYDLAISYPRKVFGDQDLSKTLTELGLLDRQALIVVPHLKVTGHSKGRSSMPNPSVSTSAARSADGESYFSLVKRYFSYVNPLAYLGSGGAANSPTSVQETRSTESGSRRSYLITSNQGTSGSGRENRASSSRFGSGSNIHTLKHDEDDSKFTGRNAFWNGNSTEYGGDGDNK